jgi:serine/threonine-protein kinase
MTDGLKDTLQGTLGNAYVLERELGGGGMSRVFLAREAALDRSVVIKVLPPELAAGVNIDRFRREILLAARLQHPHIVPLLTAGETDGLPYFTMPFIDGESLRVTIDRTGELPVQTTVRYLREIASALAYAHANGVVHRDIKPDNILISGGAAMVTDFGVAKALSAAVTPRASGQLTGLGIALGTPAYMAPEQAAADPTADARADIYSFGAMAYEMLTGQPPFAGRATPALMAAHAVEPPEPVERRRPAVPAALAALVMRCLQKRPADRPQSATEIVQSLDTMPVTPVTSAAYPAYSGAVAAPSRAGAARGRRLPRVLVAALAVVGAISIVGATLAIVRNRGGAHDKPSEPKIVVLPFQNEGPPSDAYFADGLTEAITNRLASLHHLGVIDPRSANQYKDTKATPRQIGRELGVQYLLEGTVRWASNASGAQEVQISPTLVNASDETTKLAPGPYVVQPSDVFQVQTDVATKVADALGLVLEQHDEMVLTRRMTHVPAAYDAYLRGRHYDNEQDSTHTLTPELLQRAIEQYQQAAKLDPKFAQALAELGGDEVVWALLDLSDTTRQVAAKQALDSALRLDPNLADGHLERAQYLLAFEHNQREAYDEFVRAQAERPNDAELLQHLGDAQVFVGRVDEGLANLERAVQLDPKSSDALAEAALRTFQYRRYDEAMNYADRLIALSPQDWSGYGTAMRIASEGHGDTATARRVLDRELAAIPQTTVHMFLNEVATLGPGDWPRLESLQLADVHPQQAFDTVNFYLGKMDLYVRQRRAPRASAYADSALRIMNRHSFIGPLAPDAHRVTAVAAAVAGRGELAAQGIAAIQHDGQLLDNPTGPLAADQADALAEAYNQLGDANNTITQITRMLQLPTGKSAAYFRTDPEWDWLRGNPSFQAALSGAGAKPDSGTSTRPSRP